MKRLYLNRMEQPALQKIVRRTHKPSSKAIVSDKVCTVLHINSHLISGRLDARLLKMSRRLEKRHSEDQRQTSWEIVRRSPPWYRIKCWRAQLGLDISLIEPTRRKSERSMWAKGGILLGIIDSLGWKLERIDPTNSVIHVLCTRGLEVW